MGMRTRTILAGLTSIAGGAAVVVGLAMIFVPAAIVVGGAGLLYVGAVVDWDPAPDGDDR